MIVIIKKIVIHNKSIITTNKLFPKSFNKKVKFFKSFNKKVKFFKKFTPFNIKNQLIYTREYLKTVSFKY